MAAATRHARRTFGSIRKLPSGRWQARYIGPDGQTHKAHVTFDTKGDADTWLSKVRSDIAREVWVSPDARKAADELARKQQQEFRDYAGKWLARRDLKPRTRSHYQSILDRDLLPTFGSQSLAAITRRDVDDWYDQLPSDKATRRAHAYSLLRTIMGSAVDEDRVAVSPCRIKGAGQSKRVRKIEPATLAELEAIAGGMPDRFKAALWLAAWCGLRFGELAELRRRDVDLRNPERPVVKVRRAMTYRDGRTIVGTPKSDAGIRDVAVPPHLHGLLLDHARDYAQQGRDGLLFPAIREASGRCDCGHQGCVGGHLMATVLYKAYEPARIAAGRPDLRWHDLRHTGAVLAAATGATLAELMSRLGHSTVSASLRYQHAAAGRDAEIADRLSQLASR